MDTVNEDDRVDRIEGPVLPFGHTVHDLVGNRRDRRLGNAGPVDLGQMRGDVAVRQTPGRQGQHHLVDTGQPPLPLLDDLWLEAALPVAGHLDFDWSDLGQHGLGPDPVAGVAAASAGRVVFLVAEVTGDLALQGRLEHPLGQLLEQPALAGQL
jgi:hypothetical protein